MANLTRTYKLQDDVCLANSSTNDKTTLVKLNDDDFIFILDGIAGQIVKEIADGKSKVDTIINKFVSDNGEKHRDFITEETLKLIDQLKDESLIQEAI